MSSPTSSGVLRLRQHLAGSLSTTSCTFKERGIGSCPTRFFSLQPLARRRRDDLQLRHLSVVSVSGRRSLLATTTTRSAVADLGFKPHFLWILEAAIRSCDACIGVHRLLRCAPHERAPGRQDPPQLAVP